MIVVQKLQLLAQAMQVFILMSWKAKSSQAMLHSFTAGLFRCLASAGTPVQHLTTTMSMRQLKVTRCTAGEAD